MATTPTRDRAHRRCLGIRRGRLSRHSADDRHDLGPAGDARHRHRLRHPDARTRRRRGRHRPRATPDPGDLTQPRPGAARRHLRRDLRLRGAALRQGAHAARVRAAVGHRCRRDLPEQHRRNPRGPRDPRVPITDQGTRLPRRSARPAHRMVGITVGSRRAGARDRQRDRLCRRHSCRGQARPPDRPHAMGQPAFAGRSRPERAQSRGALLERTRHLRPIT